MLYSNNSWQDKAISEWDNDVSNLVIIGDNVYMEKYWSGSLDYDPRIKLAKKELDVIRLYCYVLNI